MRTHVRVWSFVYTHMEEEDAQGGQACQWLLYSLVVLLAGTVGAFLGSVHHHDACIDTYVNWQHCERGQIPWWTPVLTWCHDTVALVLWPLKAAIEGSVTECMHRWATRQRTAEPVEYPRFECINSISASGSKLPMVLAATGCLAGDACDQHARVGFYTLAFWPYMQCAVNTRTAAPVRLELWCTDMTCAAYSLTQMPMLIL